MNLALQFTESETKILLESLLAQERQLLHTCKASEDEDAIADAGNDLVDMRLLLNRVRDAAVAQFGQRVLELSRAAL